MSVKNNPTVGSIKNVLDQAADGSVALPVTLVDTASGPINKNPTIGRLEQALAVAEDGSMAMPVEVVKLADDGSTFERVTEFGGSGTSEPVTWSDVQNKPATYQPTAHNHDERYYTKTDIDNAGYLLAQPDGETVEIQGGELRARTLTGLQHAVTQLNAWLAGTQGNIQGQINDIPYNTSTGVFTLEAGKEYCVMVEGSLYTSGYVILQLVDASTNSIVNTIARGIWMDVNPPNANWHESSAGPLKTYVTPSDTREYKIRATSVSGESSLRSSYMSLEIQEV